MTITDVFPRTLFAEQTVFVTGGGSGINLGIARNFAALGAKIGICGRTIEKLESAAAQLNALGARVSYAVADVRDPAALDAALGKARAELGPVNVLVAGAAGNFLVPAEKLSPNGFKTVVDIDLLGSFNAARAAFDQLRETRGSVIFISAGQAFMPYAFQLHVAAAKAGIDMMMRNLALEWGRYGIRVNSIAPGPIEGTEGMKRLSTPEALAQIKHAIPLGRLGTVDDIGHLAVFLASPLASYITGTLIVADGGQNLPGSALFNMGAEQALRAMEKTPR
jgi:NAD(P)-dependent dehydrogenase (short-subunit alcohol dehydrogenase family)